MPKNIGIKEEDRIAKKLNGRTTPRSGGGIIKGDVLAKMGDKNLCIQSKYTDKNSFTLKLSDLNNAERDALHEGKEPVFIVSFSGKRFWVLSEYIALDWQQQNKDV